MWTVSIGTIFPKLFPGPLGISCIGRQINKTWTLNVHDLKDFAINGRIDDEPFGGGGGMIFKADVIDRWIIESNLQTVKKIYMSPRGKVFNQNMITDYIKNDLCVLCGRYEGVDERVLQHWDFEEVSIGDFILHGGEVAAMTFVEACARFLSIKQHSFINDSLTGESKYLLESGQYTRPREWTPENTNKIYSVPPILLSGHHGNIVKWKKNMSKDLTKIQRPDLYELYMKLNTDKGENES